MTVTSTHDDSDAADRTSFSHIQDDELEFGSSVGSLSGTDEPWESLDINAYVNSDGVNITPFVDTDDLGLLIDPLDSSTSTSIDGAASIAGFAGVSRDEGTTVAPKRKSSGSETSGIRKKEGVIASPKRRRLTSLAASEKVYQFPAKLIAALNAGNMKLLGETVNEYCVDECVLKTKVIPEGMTGKEAIITFFSAVLMSCPDMISSVSDLRLKRDRSIVMKGKFEGTYVDDRNGKHAHLMFKKDKPLAEEVSESRGGSRNRPLSATEMQEFEDLDEDIRKNPNLSVGTSGTYAARVHFLSSKIGAAPGAPPHQLVTRLDWDWKTLQVNRSNFVDEE